MGGERAGGVGGGEEQGKKHTTKCIRQFRMAEQIFFQRRRIFRRRVKWQTVADEPVLIFHSEEPFCRHAHRREMIIQQLTQTPPCPTPTNHQIGERRVETAFFPQLSWSPPSALTSPPIEPHRLDLQLPWPMAWLLILTRHETFVSRTTGSVPFTATVPNTSISVNFPLKGEWRRRARGETPGDPGGRGRTRTGSRGNIRSVWFAIDWRQFESQSYFSSSSSSSTSFSPSSSSFKLT